MGLVRCRDCNHKVSTNANVCPSCGAPVKLYAWQRQQMAGSLIGFVILLLIGLWVIHITSKGCEAGVEYISDVKQDAAVRDDPERFIELARVAIDRGDLAGAKRALDQLKSAGITHDLNASYKALEVAHRAEAEALRLEGITSALAAKGCDAWEERWGKLRQIKIAELTADAKQAVKRLERCRLDAIKAREASLPDVAIARRRGIKPELDEAFFSRGLSITLKTEGANHTTITLNNVMFKDSAVVQKYIDDGLLSTLEQAGFKEVIFASGKIKHPHDLNPVQVDHEAENLAYWRDKGLHEPLELSDDGD